MSGFSASSGSTLLELDIMKVEIGEGLSEAVFPLFRVGGDDPAFLGTAFFVMKSGVFITAKHVLDVNLPAGTAIKAILFSDGNVTELDVTGAAFDAEQDLAVGRVSMDEGREFQVLMLSEEIRDLRTLVLTYGYPYTKVIKATADKKGQVHFESKARLGLISDYSDAAAEGALVPPPCYEHSLDIPPGLSGGPLLDVGTNHVFAVNSGSCDSEHGVMRSGISTSLSRILDLPLPWDEAGRTLRVLAEGGFVVIE